MFEILSNVQIKMYEKSMNSCVQSMKSVDSVVSVIYPNFYF